MWVVLAVAGMAGADPLGTVYSIRSLAPEEAEQALPVLLEGQVLQVTPPKNGFFLHDGNKGIYVRSPVSKPKHAQLHSGEMVRVRGKTSPGWFSPAVVAEEVEVLGRQPLPETRPFNAHEMYSATIDCDWVSVRGRLISVKTFASGPKNSNSIMLELEFNDSVLDVQAPYSKASAEKLAGLIFQRVRFDAVAGTRYNNERQIIGRIFYVNSADDFEVIDDYEPPGGVKSRPINELMRDGVNHRLPVGTYGVVTRAVGRDLFLRGEKACLKATLPAASEVQVGDFVALEGFARPRPISPAFLARSVNVLEHKAPPAPVTLELNEALKAQWQLKPDSSLDQELVSIDVQLVDVGKTFGVSSGQDESPKERILLCRQGSSLLEAKLPADAVLDERLAPGAILRLTGICNLIRSEEMRWRLYIDGFWIQLRDANDVMILAPAPWWTATRLLWLLGIGLGVLALSLIWVAALRKTVDKQTGIIGKQIERETILDERQRIARELHDNLEQGLAGMAIQLRGALRLLELNMEKRLESIRSSVRLLKENKASELEQHLEKAGSEVVKDAARNRKAIDVVRSMLAYCSEESRSSILDLRGGVLERMDLSAALQETLEPLARECGARLDFLVKGEPRRLKQVAERNLLLIAKEAASNAARHAKPGRIGVELAYSGSGLALRIEDDGCGFSVDGVPKVGRFGLQGMHERINHLEGTIQVKSRLGEGTSIQVEIASVQKWEME
ncbi:Sensor histidine kinase LiaS [Pontiella sulfatireligans]|uniref:Sensor histidine kinase LiaS n=1 Tax=Pontiella sulfatireligans TaxID=2750658 RepID=A0A6C2UQ62_9BACT|nr:Sensor histidine kinase LiaS [Pontiella sulfatireligans]